MLMLSELRSGQLFGFINAKIQGETNSLRELQEQIWPRR